MIRQAIKLAKNSLPRVVKQTVGDLYRSARIKISHVEKHLWANRATRVHKRLLMQNRGARPIRVMFLVSNTASWKVGPLFAEMMRDPEFKPIAVICPIITGHLANAAQHTAELTRRYLQKEGFPYCDTTELDEEQTRNEIHRIDAHVAFFTNPHGLVPKYLHDDILVSRLTCYVPYHHEVVSYGENQEQYNQLSHNLFWKIFVPHEESRLHYLTTRIRRDEGVVVSGFPACEPMLDTVFRADTSPWKPQASEKKRVIYAPHWLSRPDIKLATIDLFGDVILQLAEKYRDHIQWALRPHPMLKPHLMKKSNWGALRTENFFRFWEESYFSQIHEDDYLPLFFTSDAIIHDSGSFLAEYLYLKKPAMYLMTDETGEQYFNNFGRRAVSAHSMGRSAGDIQRFLDQLLADQIRTDTIVDFFDKDISPHYRTLPSKKICGEIKNAFAE